MFLRRFVLGVLASVPLLAALPGAALALSPDQARAFIQQAGDRLVAIVNGPGSQSQKANALRDLVNQVVAVDQVGDYVLGRYINIATPEQKQQFHSLFHQLIAYNITYQIKAYQGVSFTVNGTAPQGNGVVVDTTVTAPDKQPADVGWVVEDVGGQPKIVDVIVAGTSLRITTRNDYAGVINDNGGRFAALLTAMQNQIDKIAAQSG